MKNQGNDNAATLRFAVVLRVSKQIMFPTLSVNGTEGRFFTREEALRVTELPTSATDAEIIDALSELGEAMVIHNGHQQSNNSLQTSPYSEHSGFPVGMLASAYNNIEQVG